MAPNLLIAFVSAVISLAQPYNHDVQLSSKQTYCLAEALYYEARGEGISGQIAVSHVVLNRTKLGRQKTYHIKDQHGNMLVRTRTVHESICTTIHLKHQFSYLAVHKKLIIRDKLAWQKAVMVAVYTQLGIYTNPIQDAIYYNTEPVKSWGNVVEIATIAHHTFYADQKSHNDILASQMRNDHGTNEYNIHNISSIILTIFRYNVEQVNSSLSRIYNNMYRSVEDTITTRYVSTRNGIATTFNSRTTAYGI